MRKSYFALLIVGSTYSFEALWVKGERPKVAGNHLFISEYCGYWTVELCVKGFPQIFSGRNIHMAANSMHNNAIAFRDISRMIKSTTVSGMKTLMFEIASILFLCNRIDPIEFLECPIEYSPRGLSIRNMDSEPADTSIIILENVVVISSGINTRIHSLENDGSFCSIMFDALGLTNDIDTSYEIVREFYDNFIEIMYY